MFLAFSAAPYEVQTISLRDLFAGKLDVVNRDRSLFVEQPNYGAFYSRLFAGIIQNDNTMPLSANHSYYDLTDVEEYFDVDPAHERNANLTLALIKDLQLKVRLYPITSPAEIVFGARYFDSDGKLLADKRNIARRTRNSHSIIEIDLDALSPEGGASAVDLYATCEEEGKIPTRITLQVCYGRAEALASSINLSLNSPYVFVPENKTGLNWMEAVGLEDVENRIAVSHSSPVPDDAEHIVKLTLYRDQDETTLETEFKLKGHAGFGGKLEDLLPEYKEFLGGRNGFMYLASDSPFLRSISIQTHSKTGHTSGEHSF